MPKAYICQEERSVLWHLGVDLFAPCLDAAGEVGYAGEAGLLEELGDALRADARVAVDDDFAVAVDF